MDDKVFYPYQKQEYPIAVKGEGIYLWDETGKRYVDASSGPVEPFEKQYYSVSGSIVRY